MMKTVLAGAFMGLMTGAALAQAPAPDAAPAAPGKPEVKTVQDWAVRCFPVQSPSPCDIFQELDNQRTGQRVISMSIAFYPSLNRHALVIAVPLEVSIPKGLKLQTSSFTSPMLKYRRCDRNGCYIEMAVDNGLIESLARSSGDGGKINISADNGKAYSLNFSLKGFSAAHDDMVSQARVKAKAAPAAPVANP
jgi:invasion protein IalB